MEWSRELWKMVEGDMNAHIWELDGCEDENGRRMKESMNDLGLQILNCVWNGLSEAYKTMPGWSNKDKEEREDALLWPWIWCEAGRPIVVIYMLL